ncbi:MAG: hypothetical protein ABIH76_00340 [Candidatus Bathyarchaeota archaeon]
MVDPHVPMERLKQEVTSVTLVNNTAKTEDVTVPQGERWLLLGAKLANPDDVARVVGIDIYKEAAKTNLLRQLFQFSANASTSRQWPSWPSGSTSGSCTFQFALVILDAGNTLKCFWEAGGASAGGVDADGLVIEYLKVEI